MSYNNIFRHQDSADRMCPVDPLVLDENLTEVNPPIQYLFAGLSCTLQEEEPQESKHICSLTTIDRKCIDCYRLVVQTKQNLENVLHHTNEFIELQQEVMNNIVQNISADKKYDFKEDKIDINKYVSNLKTIYHNNEMCWKVSDIIYPIYEHKNNTNRVIQDVRNKVSKGVFQYKKTYILRKEGLRYLSQKYKNYRKCQTLSKQVYLKKLQKLGS